MKLSIIKDLASKYDIPNSVLEELLEFKYDINKKDLVIAESFSINVDELKNDLEKLSTGYPIEYITHKSLFYGLEFFVNENVLIPRNDTEILVDLAINEIKTYGGKLDIIDIGTGSANIIISILKGCDNISRGYACDVSDEALEIVNKNIRQSGLNDVIITIKSNLLEYFLNNNVSLNNSIVITANLPYIKDGDYENMDKETYQYEPKLALFGGKNTGFELYERLIDEITELKNKYDTDKIILFIEIGFDQYKYSIEYLYNKGLEFEHYKDNNEIARVIKILF